MAFEILDGVGAVLTWAFDRKAREEARLHSACQSAKAYIDVDEGNPPYDKLTEDKRKKYKLHFKKRVLAWS